MAEAPSHTPTPSPSASDAETLQYWCHRCEKRVSVETLPNQPDVICLDCKGGFVESIAAASPPSVGPPTLSFDQIDEPSFGSQFLQVLRLIAQAARDEDAPPSPPPDRAHGDDFLRIELNGWDIGEGEDDPGEVELRNEAEDEEEEEGEDRSDNETDENGSDNRQRDEEEDMRRRRSDVLRLRIQDFAARSGSGRHRFLDLAEILMGLDDNSIELRVEMPESEEYIGNPEDYVDAAEYEALLQNLAESDGGGRRGPPPASKSAISALQTAEITSEADVLVCAICKDAVNVGETARKLPCGHGYHGDCIVPWLGSRNSCPVCRFELPTDDPEYEEERKKKTTAFDGGASGSRGGNSVIG
ncbi:E3 ubiquitin-protein ligase CIP8 [Malania oleifera]|uniref:E3 ubiquitin-protein ligase CIP8 n=1 Tax=Malania oleifera TaxID=397392 RepID=UPI0025AE064D|nr:E3 ubiquitin-protein ligase CIP8 [Malania oleifera]XP_057973181.1 E3 ubiquitin-protein ligase CIP8 [Malania oleifera]